MWHITLPVLLVFSSLVLAQEGPRMGFGGSENDQKRFAQPGFGQQRFVQPVFGQQIFTQPGSIQQRYRQSGLGHQVFAQPGFGQQGFVHPGSGQQGLVQLGLGQQGFGQQGFGQPDFGQQGFGQPGSGQQGFAKPILNQQGTGFSTATHQGYVQQGFGQLTRSSIPVTGPDNRQNTASDTSDSCHFWCRGPQKDQFYCCDHTSSITTPNGTNEESGHPAGQSPLPQEGVGLNIHGQPTRSGTPYTGPVNRETSTATSATCRHWCKGEMKGQFYCCEEETVPATVPIVKPGGCPPLMPTCPRFDKPETTCSDDSKCSGYDKCCFNTCTKRHVCKYPVL